MAEQNHHDEHEVDDDALELAAGGTKPEYDKTRNDREYTYNSTIYYSAGGNLGR